MAPPRSITLCKKPDTRTSSINALTAASGAGGSFGTTIFCGTLNRSSGNSLVPSVAVESVVRRWRLHRARRLCARSAPCPGIDAAAEIGVEIARAEHFEAHHDRAGNKSEHIDDGPKHSGGYLPAHLHCG